MLKLYYSLKLDPLDPDTAGEFFPVLGHRGGKRAIWRWTSVSKQQIRHAGGDER